jgi:hypothetical protein
MLVPVSRTPAELSRHHVLLLTAAALVICLVPTLHAVPVLAQQSKPPQSGPTDHGVDGGASKSAIRQSPSKEGGGSPIALDHGDTPGASPLDEALKAIPEPLRKRMAAWIEEQTTEKMTLKDGQSHVMQIKKNPTPIAQVRITPHIVGKGTRFDLECLDAAGKRIPGYKTTSSSVQNKQCLNLGPSFSIGGQVILPTVDLRATHGEGGLLEINAMVRTSDLPTDAEIDALLRSQGKRGEVQRDFGAIDMWIWQYRNETGHYPKTLAELNKSLPKDRYSPTGADYHYERQNARYILGSCGADGVWGTADDQVQVHGPAGVSSGERHELYPLEEEKDPPLDERKEAAARPQRNPWEPIARGNCLIRGKLVSAVTTKPIAGAMIYLFYVPTFSPLFVNSGSDGSFEFKDLPRGPFLLQSSHVPGYQEARYDPQGQGGAMPQFSLAEREHRSNIVIQAKPACSVSGMILDENGEVPEHVDSWTVLAWFKTDDGYQSAQAMTKGQDGSYRVDGLSGEPVYVMAINWHAAQQGDASPPVYYPGTFSRSDAKQVTFDKMRSVEHIDITLRKQGGLVLEGTVRDRSGKPVPEAFVVVHRRDMLFDFVTDYTDKQGHYRIQGLGDGEFLVHVDAMHRGLVRTRAPINLAKNAPPARLDFTLLRGVTISGKLVDEKGQPWQIAQTDGLAWVNNVKENCFSLGRFRNKYESQDSLASSFGYYAGGAGSYADGRMLFPTDSTFLVQGLLPGHTQIELSPHREGQQVMKILCQGRDIMASGVDTSPGQQLKDVTIVIGGNAKVASR